MRDEALYQAREFRGKTLYTPRCLILDVDESLGSMSKDGYFSHQSASDVDSLSGYAASSWGGNVSISRFESVPKVPFQRTLEESFHLHTSSGRSSGDSSNPTHELIRAKKHLIESKKSEVEAMKAELTTKAKNGNAEGSYLFDLQSKIGDLESEIVALSADIERRLHLYRVLQGEEVDHDMEFDLTDSKYWTDYNKTFWHPTCLNTLKDLSLSSPIDVYSTEYLSAEEFEHYFDNFRHHIEQADQLEGLHVMVDCDTTFGAMSTTILDEVRDGYGKMHTVTFPIFSLDGSPSIGQNAKDTSRIRRMNRAMTLSALHASSSIVLPFDCSTWKSGTSFPHLDTLKLHNPYHASAIIASTIDSITLPYRLLSSGLSMRQHTDSLVPTLNNFGLVSTALPLPLTPSNTLSHQFFGYDIYSDPATRTAEERIAASGKRILPHAGWMTSMIPFAHGEKTHNNDMEDTERGVALPWSESVILRGVPTELARDPSDPAEYQAPSILYQYLKRYPCASRLFAAEKEASAIPIAYPNFFEERLSITRNAPTLTHVQNTPRLADFFRYLAIDVTPDIAHKYPTLNYDREKILASRDSLLTLQEDYSQ